jgi:hypothetical protein
VEGIAIYGDTPFIEDVIEAFCRLKASYPYGFRLVQRYIRGIIQSDTEQRIGSPIRIIYVKCTVAGRLTIPPSRFAAYLVRRAFVFRKLLGFAIWRSTRSEITSLNRELHAMRLLQCDSKYFHRVLNQILNREKRVPKDIKNS